MLSWNVSFMYATGHCNLLNIQVAFAFEKKNVMPLGW